MGRWSRVIVCGAMAVGVMAADSIADIYRFAGTVVGGSENWIDRTNWQNQTASRSGWAIDGGITPPRSGDVVRFDFRGSAAVLDGDAGIIKQLQIGLASGGGALTLNEGARLVIYSGNNSVGEGDFGLLLINGGHLSCGGSLCIAGEKDSVFELNDGLVRVDSIFFHNKKPGLAPAQSMIRGGMLDVNAMVLNAGILNVSGGVVRIRSVSREQIKRWVSDGLITFNGLSGGIEKIHYTLTPWGDGFEIVAIKDPAVFG